VIAVRRNITIGKYEDTLVDIEKQLGIVTIHA
jgi:hypothetical protein